MENLVLQALGNDEVERINKIKKNKEFLRRLINDLGNVYHLYLSNVDSQNSSKYNIKKQSNYINTIFFNANEDGCKFSTKILAVKKSSNPKWEMGWILEKYDTCKAEKSFHDNNHGYIEVEIKFTENSPNLMDIIKDITRIFDHEKVSKKF